MNGEGEMQQYRKREREPQKNKVQERNQYQTSLVRTILHTLLQFPTYNSQNPLVTRLTSYIQQPSFQFLLLTGLFKQKTVQVNLQQLFQTKGELSKCKELNCRGQYESAPIRSYFFYAKSKLKVQHVTKPERVYKRGSRLSNSFINQKKNSIMEF